MRTRGKGREEKKKRLNPCQDLKSKRGKKKEEEKRKKKKSSPQNQTWVGPTDEQTQ